MKISILIIYILFTILLLLPQNIENRRIIYKKLVNKNADGKIIKSNIISAPKICPKNQKLDSHSRCRKVF